MIPNTLQNLIDLQPRVKKRTNEELAIEQLKIVGIDTESEFAIFYRQYMPGSLDSKACADTLCDIAESTNEILEGTKFIHEMWELPGIYVCFSSLQSEGGFLLNTENGMIWDFDLGQHAAFMAGEIKPRWNVFFEFLEWYLS